LNCGNSDRASSCRITASTSSQRSGPQVKPLASSPGRTSLFVPSLGILGGSVSESSASAPRDRSASICGRAFSAMSL